MKPYLKYLPLVGLLLAIWIGIPFFFYQRSIEEKSIRRLQAEDEVEINWIYFKMQAGQVLFVVVPAAIIVGGLVLIACFGLAKIRKSSVHIYRIGEYNEIPVHHKDLSIATPIAMGLMNAEQLKQENGGLEKAFKIYETLADIQIKQARSLGFRQPLALPGGQDIPQEVRPTPTLAELLQRGELAPGRASILGYAQGEPIKRSLRDCKSLAVTGQQGSGKTLTIAYLVSVSVLCDHALAYVIDPHHGHAEGLSTYLQPLIETGRAQTVGSFETPQLIRQLDHLLDRRLAGIENSDPTIIFVIDELARLAKLDIFDGLVAFLERCSEETRKANIVFIGASHKWTARHFKNRADIRACMNSALIHNTKPSMADLLLEDAHDKKLVKEITQPGQAILMTDFSQTQVIQIPYLTIQDVQQIAQRVGIMRDDTLDVAFEAIASHSEPVELPDNVITFPTMGNLTLPHVRQWAGTFSSKAEAARHIGIDRTYLSRILSGERDLTPEIQQKITESVTRDKRDNAQKTA